MAAAAFEVEQDAAEAAETLRERLRSIVANLEREAEDRVGKRADVEQRWLEDLRQFHGVYDSIITKSLKDAKKSTLFINQTRPKTNAMEARLSDMLFPTDDRNWGIEPTPVPELTVEAEETAMKAAEAKRASAEDPQNPELQQAATVAESDAQLIKLRMDEARKRSRAMQEEIDDHLRACNYTIQAREAIRDAARIGTGVMKGPVIGGRTRRSWQMTEGQMVEGQQVEGQFAMQQQQVDRPVYWRVDPWSFFPDSDAHNMEESEGVYERHLLNPKQLRALAKEPGYDKDAIRDLLRDEARSSAPYWIADLRSITGATTASSTDRYHVWEYHGPLSAEDMRDLATISGNAEMIEDINLDEVDPLTELLVNVWFSQGHVLKFGVHYLDSGDSIYSVFNLEKDEASIFGFGVPYMMRDSQKSLSAAWRIMMDNAGLSSGPQIVIDDEVIEPIDGSWVLEPRKVWRKKKGALPGAKPFETFNIPMYQTELANIIEISKQNIDDETAISTISQGEQGSHTTQTLGGMTILMNAVNVVFRRIVKNWDDDMTTPNIRRMYDWLMQFSKKNYIKGDFEVDARGTSVLLVREMQSANLIVFLQTFGVHPTLSKYLKEEGLPALRRLAQTMMMPADEIIKTNEEIAEDEARAAEQPPQPNIEVMKIENDMERVRIEAESRERTAHMNRETELIKLAQTHNIELEKLKGMLFDKQADRDSKERILSTEVAVEARQAANGQDDKGSGGYIS